MEKKLSSVEWLIGCISKDQMVKAKSLNEWLEIFEQAKAMHKEEMFEYIKQKYCIGQMSLEFHRLEFEEYYKETFGG